MYFTFLVVISLREPGPSQCIPKVLNAFFYVVRPGRSLDVVSLSRSAFLVRRITSTNFDMRAQFSWLSSITLTTVSGEFRPTTLSNDYRSCDQRLQMENVCFASSFSAPQYRQVGLPTYHARYDSRDPSASCIYLLGVFCKGASIEPRSSLTCPCLDLV